MDENIFFNRLRKKLDHISVDAEGTEINSLDYVSHICEQQYDNNHTYLLVPTDRVEEIYDPSTDELDRNSLVLHNIDLADLDLQDDISDSPREEFNVANYFNNENNEDRDTVIKVVGALDSTTVAESNFNEISGSAVQKTVVTENEWTHEVCPSPSSKTKSSCKQKQHDRQPPRLHPCTECDLVFTVPSRLKSHMLSVHFKFRPHKCNICKKSFSKLGDLKKHKNTHTGTKPYKCTICEEKFTDKSNLERHKETHSKRKSFKCPVCGKKYSQLACLNRHRTISSAAIHGSCGFDSKLFECSKCGKKFGTADLLQEHERTHEADNLTSDVGRNVDALIEGILQEDTQTREHGMTQPTELTFQTDGSHRPIMDNYEIELINEIDRLQRMSETNADFNVRHDFLATDHTNLNIANNETDIYNALQDVNLNAVNVDISENILMPKSEVLDLVCNQNECATIFESDVDLESSANLAANLNQLIAENNVEFVSTEYDDTFIINLNSTIDAEQLSDLLNIGIEVIQEDCDTEIKERESEVKKEVSESVKEIKLPGRRRGPKFYVCKVCRKTFKRKDNYVSHLSIHNPVLSRHRCEVCRKLFGYRSTLNKHFRAVHTPAVLPCHRCTLCGATYKQLWMLTNHVRSKHERVTPYRCPIGGCDRTFGKKSDHRYHIRQHIGDKPYECERCGRRFMHSSHRASHSKICSDQLWKKQKPRKSKLMANSAETKELLSDIDDLLKSKMAATL